MLMVIIVVIVIIAVIFVIIVTIRPDMLIIILLILILLSDRSISGRAVLGGRPLVRHRDVGGGGGPLEAGMGEVGKWRRWRGGRCDDGCGGGARRRGDGCRGGGGGVVGMGGYQAMVGRLAVGEVG